MLSGGRRLSSACLGGLQFTTTGEYPTSPTTTSEVHRYLLRRPLHKPEIKNPAEARFLSK